WGRRRPSVGTGRRRQDARADGSFGQFVRVGHRNATHDPVHVVLVMAHPPEGGAVDMDRGRGRPAGMPNAVNVRGREVEALSCRVLARVLPDPAVGVAEERVLAEHACADVDRARRLVVIVVARVLGLVPADQPNVDARVPVELDEVALVRVVAHERLPEFRPSADLPGEGGHRSAIQGPAAGGAGVDQSREGGDRLSSRSGFAETTALVTASPNDATASSAWPGSMTGMSLPKSS